MKSPKCGVLAFMISSSSENLKITNTNNVFSNNVLALGLTQTCQCILTKLSPCFVESARFDFIVHTNEQFGSFPQCRTSSLNRHEGRLLRTNIPPRVSRARSSEV